MSDNIKPTIMALGYFDSVHIGHRKVIEKAREQAEIVGAKTVVFTFEDNLRGKIHDKDEKVVYLKCEREKIYTSLGVDEICFAPVNEEFLALEKQEFLRLINQKYNIKAYVTGSDYRFGKKGAGTVKDLEEYAKNNGQQSFVVETQMNGHEKISTTDIKKLLQLGKVSDAKKLLERAYSVTGKVFEDRKVGTKIGFPTVNVRNDCRKVELKDGVYFGRVEFDNKQYKALINYGARPTFNLNEKLIEAHILDYSGCLYGKEITVYFDDYIRDIVKFESVNQLQQRLKKDIEEVEGKNYD